MINKKKVSLNIFFSILQTGFIGLTYFFLYRFLLNRLGEKEMGVWAIVLSVSSVANLANMGIGASVVRLTAKYVAINSIGTINKVIHTALIFIAAFFGLLSILIYFVAPFWLKAVIDSEFFPVSVLLIPYSLAGLWINAVSGVFISCLDGFQKNFIRSILYIASSALLLLMSLWLIPKYGIIGIAYSQLLQAGMLLLSSVLALKLTFRSLSLFPFQWDKIIFKNIFSFGVKEQIISICQLCFDPLTKSLLSSFGSLSLVTYYEMANRLVIQMRALLVSANQVFIPVFAGIHEKESEERKQALYQKVFSFNLLSTLLWSALLGSILIPFGELWIGSYKEEFLVSGLVLIVAYSFNILCSPAYFANMGTGTLNDNVISNVAICVFNLLLGYLLGSFFSGYGVLIAWGVALISGSLFVIIAYHKRNKTKTGAFFSKHFYFIMLMGIACVIVCNYFFLTWALSPWQMFVFSGIIFLIFCLIPTCKHPDVRALSHKVRLKFNV
jgi:O-antigen/teichoic acid export membrane protein